MEKNQVILEKVLAKLEKSGKKFAKPQGKLYLELKRIYLIFAIYLLFMNVSFIVSGISALIKVDKEIPLIIPMVFVLASSVAIVVSYCFISKQKFYLLSGIMNVLSSVALLLYHASINTDYNGFLGLKAMYYWRFFIPLVVMLVLFTWLTVIVLRAKKIIDTQYKKYVDYLYNEYTEQNGTVSYGEWEEYLENYTLEAVKNTSKSGKKDAR